MSFLFPFEKITLNNITENENILEDNIRFCENVYNEYKDMQANNYTINYTYNTSSEDMSDELDYLLNSSEEYLSDDERTDDELDSFDLSDNDVFDNY